MKIIINKIFLFYLITLSFLFTNKSNTMGIFKTLLSCCNTSERSELIKSPNDFIGKAVTKKDASAILEFSKQYELKNYINVGEITLLHSALEYSTADLIPEIGKPTYKKEMFNSLKLLLENGGKESINKTDKCHRTPLFWACERAFYSGLYTQGQDFTDIVQLLIVNGADIKAITDHKNNTAMQNDKIRKLFDITNRFQESLKDNTDFSLSEEDQQDESLVKFLEDLRKNNYNKQ